MWQSVLILLFSLFFAPGLVGAEKLYKFVDENGHVTFTDKAVGTGTLEKVAQVRKERPMQRFKVQNRGSKSEPVFFAVNGYFGPVEAEFTLKNLQNMSAKSTRLRMVVPAASDVPTLSMRQVSSQRRSSYQWEARSVFGDPAAQHLPKRPYLLPIPANKNFRFSQVFLGAATHAGNVQSEYAVDIPMPVGTAIHAARSGIIMDVAGDFFEGGVSEGMMEQANYVCVLHDDGTMAIYAHLELETVKFPIGKRIERGQVLALSGNTGFSSGPHLHFAIQKNFGMELRSIPFEYEGIDGKPFTPIEGLSISRNSER